jgi:hypothetical protein
MPSYYTYGEMPDPEEAVYGVGGLDSYYNEMPIPAGAGFASPFADEGRESVMPVGADTPINEEPIYSGAVTDRETIMPTGEEERLTQPSPVATTEIPAASYFVPGLTTSVTPTGSTLEAGQKAMALASLIDPSALKAMNFQVGDAAFGGGAGGSPMTLQYYRNIAPDTVGGQGSFYEEGALEAAKANAADPTQGLFKSGFEALAGQPGIQEAIQAKSQRDFDAIAKVESDYDVMKPLSDLLKANKFKEAFDYAKDKGVEDKLMQSNWLAQLRQPFTPEEMKDFFKSMPPGFAGSKFDFTPEMGTTSGADYGYPDPQSAYQRKEDTTIKDVVRFGLDVMLAAAGVPPIQSGLTKAAYTLAETGGNVEAALKAGVAAAAGAKVGEFLRTPGLSEVTPTGAVAGTTGAAARAATEAAKQGVASGLSGGALQEIVVQAARAAAPGLAETAVRTLASSALTEAVKPSVAETPKAAEPVKTDQVARVTEPSGLEEVVVSGKRYFQPSIQSALASAATSAGTQDILSERQIKEAQEAEQRAAEEAQKPEDLEEVKVTAKRPALLDPLDLLRTGTVPDFSKELMQKGLYDKPIFEDVPIKDIPKEKLEEIVVKGTAPVKGGLTVGDVAAGLGSAAAANALLTQGYTQPNVDPLTGEPKEVPKTQQELDAIQKALATGAAIPGTGGALDTIKSLLEKYGTLENALKVLGAIGAAGSKTPTTTAITPTVPSMGGALPKYTYTRQQLRPDIDYYTYGTRPEAKFFEQGLQLEKPVQPPPPADVNPPDENKPMAYGGLTGYAHGGSHSSRYVDGPGSGRDDKIPALLSDGEYVIDAETLALLGDGSTKEGAKRLDEFRANIRKHKGQALSRGQISPNAKSPEKYMGGGLT